MMVINLLNLLMLEKYARISDGEEVEKDYV